MPADRGGRHRRGKKTPKRYRKGRLATQRKFRGGVDLRAFANTVKSRVVDTAAAAKQQAARLKEHVEGKIDDAKVAAAAAVGKVSDANNASYADTYSEFLIKELNEYFKREEFQKLKNEEAALNGDDKLDVMQKLLKFDFTKSQYYSPQAWQRMIDKLREFSSKDSSVPEEEKGEMQNSFELLKRTGGRGDLPYYDLSNVEETISKIAAAREAQRAAYAAAEAERQAAEAERRGNRGDNDFNTASTALGLFGSGRRNRTKRSKSKRHTRRR
jgi:hypothetical protein